MGRARAPHPAVTLAPTGRPEIAPPSGDHGPPTRPICVTTLPGPGPRSDDVAIITTIQYIQGAVARTAERRMPCNSEERRALPPPGFRRRRVQVQEVVVEQDVGIVGTVVTGVVVVVVVEVVVLAIFLRDGAELQSPCARHTVNATFSWHAIDRHIARRITCSRRSYSACRSSDGFVCRTLVAPNRTDVCWEHSRQMTAWMASMARTRLRNISLACAVRAMLPSISACDHTSPLRTLRESHEALHQSKRGPRRATTGRVPLQAIVFGQDLTRQSEIGRRDVPPEPQPTNWLNGDMTGASSHRIRSKYARSVASGQPPSLPAACVVPLTT